MIVLDESKCVGCNSCIRECPVREANIARTDGNGKTIIHVDPDKCIKCGNCIKSCNHKARSFTDDTDAFFRDLRAGAKITLIAAPSMKVLPSMEIGAMC